MATSSQTHIFWQANERLQVDDFKGSAIIQGNHKGYCDSFNLCTIASTGFFKVLDIPKKKKDRGKLLERVYIAPAFDMSSSIFYPLDSVGLQRQQLVFDMHELWARIARKNLKGIEDSTMIAYGMKSIFFVSVTNNAEREMSKMIGGFTRQVYMRNEEGAYEKWRQLIDERLKEVEAYATTRSECYRFVKNEPIDNRYKPAKKLVGDLPE